MFDNKWNLAKEVTSSTTKDRQYGFLKAGKSHRMVVQGPRALNEKSKEPKEGLTGDS